MGRSRAFDMDVATLTAAKLFWKKGYSGTSLNDLTAALGIGPASFYFAFGSKEALFRRIVDGYIAFQAEAFARAFREETTRAAVTTLLHGYVDVVTDPGHAPGCLLVNSLPSTNAGSELRHWLERHREAARIRLEHRFQADLADGRLANGFDPKAMARYVATLAGGLAVEAQSGGSRQDLYDMVDFALKDFAAGETGPKRGRKRASHHSRPRGSSRI